MFPGSDQVLESSCSAGLFAAAAITRTGSRIMDNFHMVDYVHLTRSEQGSKQAVQRLYTYTGSQTRRDPARDAPGCPLDPARDLTAARPNCKSRSAPYRKPHGSRRETDRAPDGSLTETGRQGDQNRRTLGVMTSAGVYAEDMPNGRRFKCDLSIRTESNAFGSTQTRRSTNIYAELSQRSGCG
ncbi:hypothetical protein Bbelb_117310 [Branchiostoma belcheri]|nr:hypothetical protein Bbelb_117310 [Branchiostoma belcheri]